MFENIDFFILDLNGVICFKIYFVSLRIYFSVFVSVLLFFCILYSSVIINVIYQFVFNKNKLIQFKSMLNNEVNLDYFCKMCQCVDNQGR